MFANHFSLQAMIDFTFPTLDKLLYNEKIILEFLPETKPDVDFKALANFQLGPAFFYIFDTANLKYEWISPEVQEVLGWVPAEVTANLMLKSVHPDDLPLFSKIESRIHDFLSDHYNRVTEYKIIYHYRIKRKDGGFIRVLRQLFNVKGEGRMLRFGIVTDITGLFPEGEPFLKIINWRDNTTHNIDISLRTKIKCPLSKREFEIASLIVNGLTSREISEKLFVSYQTVKTHRKNIYYKLGCNNEIQLTKAFLNNSWYELINV